MPTGLSEQEEADWCKSKAEYKALWLKKDKTKAEVKQLRDMMEEYRDWHRYWDIKGKKLKYSPSKHKSAIFDEFKAGGY